ncbi:unnamed protein product [Rotaria sp. Silwood2]|nr:unnamed protein product [Rotaria sp. Silwood2]CAF3002324.1 unnamed protein product [Rotaria sp. Silwood2]
MCRCSQASIPYLQFVSVNPRFHQVCLSDFVNEDWFSSLFNINTSNYYPLDFRLMASAQFQVLSALCRTSRRAVIDAFHGFAVKPIFSLNALSRDVLDSYIGTSIEQFQKDTFESFRSCNHFISAFIAEHRFISALRTNFYTRSVPDTNISETFSAIYPQQVNLTQSSFMSNETCRCDRTSDCIYPAGIYNQTRAIIPNEVFSLDALPLFIVPGFQVGCVPQNALLQSTLECFYNQSCLDTVISLTGALRTVSPLNISNSFSRFSPTTPIAVLFDNLMIESWENSIDFVTYFQTCAPKACSYSYVQRFSLIYMITTMVSVFGGLSAAFLSSQQIIVRNPSLDEFEHLHDMYSSILSCPCRYSSIPRSIFIFNELQIHPFCTSSFVRDDRWFQYWTMKFLNGSIDLNPPFYWTDFRKNGLKFFNYVKILCDIANRSLSELMNSFQAEYFFSPQPITQREFNETTKNWKDSLNVEFFQIYSTKFSPVVKSIQQSGLVSFDFIDPSMIFRQINNTWVLQYASVNTYNYNNLLCDYGQSYLCFKQLGFYDKLSSYTRTNVTPYQIIPGLSLGYYFLDFGYSTLECFFDESCVQMLIDRRLYDYENIYLPIDLSNITALNPNDLIFLKPNFYLDDIMAFAFVNQLIYIGDYALYYAQCQPEICTYAIDKKLHPIALVNLVIGLIGGLNVLLRLSVPSFIKIVHLINNLRLSQALYTLNDANLISFEAMTSKALDIWLNSFTIGIDKKSVILSDNVYKWVSDILQANQFHNQYMTSWSTEFSNFDENYILRNNPVLLSNGACLCPSGVSNCTKIPIYYNSTNNSNVLPGKRFNQAFSYASIILQRLIEISKEVSD